MLELLVKKLQKFTQDMNHKGIPIPVLRDPKTGKGSVSLTLVFISFNACLAGLAGKLTKILDGVDLSSAITLFGICCGLYWSRSFSKDGNKVEMKKELTPNKAEE